MIPTEYNNHLSYLKIMHLSLDTEKATADIAQKIALALKAGDILFLEGELGAGKTAFTRYLARALGITTRVKSPTYTLVESYELNKSYTEAQTLHHFDLYRLSSPREWFSAGFEEYLNQTSITIIEWPSQARGALPSADITLTLEHVNECKRKLTLQANSDRGNAILCTAF